MPIAIRDKIAANVQSGTPKRLLRELPRATRIGPASGLWYRTEALGERIYVHKRFHKDIEIADGQG